MLIDRHPRITLVAAVLIGLALAASLRHLPPQTIDVGLSPVAQTAISDPGSPSVGAVNADVTIVVFTDYQCAICKATSAALDQARLRDSNIRVIYKDLPILGEDSHLAARTALAAGFQGKYVPVHNALMQSRRRFDAAGVQAAATNAGVDWERLKIDLRVHDAQIERQLDRHAAQAWSLGIEGTPAYLVGPLLVRGGLSTGALRSVIAAARRK